MPSNNRKIDHLSPRLRAIADLVPPCGRILDIGTDHAWLPIELINSGRCREAAAVDIRPGPLAVAGRHIQDAGLSGRIKTCQNDGLQQMALAADDVVVLAGLGGYEIMRILGDDPCKCRSIILQPMKSLPELRIWLFRNGYAIDQEKLVMEQNHAYVILACHFSGEYKEMDQLTAQIGPCLPKTRPAEWPLYLQRLLHRLARQSRGEPELLPVISQIEDLAKKLAGYQTNIPGGSNAHE